jgi:hypothetical protein
LKRLRFALLFEGHSLERWHLRCLELLEECADRADGGEVGNLDFVLKLGRGPVQPEMARAARHGVWFFQHETAADEWPFYREVYEGQDVTHCALLAAGTSHGDVVLEQGWFRTQKRSYSANRDRVLASIAAWPARACGRLLHGAATRAVRPPIPSASADRPRRPSLLRLGIRVAGRRLSFAWERLFRHPQWNIGVLPVSVETLLRPGAYSDASIEWFPLTDRRRFLADPFGIVRAGKLHVLYEDFEYRSEKGDIRALEHSERGFTRQPEPAISLPVHMSYPFLLEDQGETYCVPETGRAGEIALYRAVEFPGRWTKVAVLVGGFAGVDPTVFRHEGRWWLMCTEMGRDEDAALWIWHAADLRGPWIPHARNPVKTDVRGSRPGGVPFVHDGGLYRPAQDCSRAYGWRIVIQRVTALTPSEFAEEPAAVLEPSPDSPYPLGRHTLASAGDVVLIDGHRAVFVWPAFRSFLRIWGRDLAHRLRRR